MCTRFIVARLNATFIAFRCNNAHLVGWGSVQIAVVHSRSFSGEIVMSSWSFVRWLPAVLAPSPLFVRWSTAAQPQRAANSADERLRALYTEEP